MGDSVGFREEFVSSAPMRRVLGLSKSVYIRGSFGDGLKITVSTVCLLFAFLALQPIVFVFSTAR
jgi:hypothetical protein